MCQNSFMERNEQIERCLERGMPKKIVKSVMYTLKKRAKQNEKFLNETQEEVLKETQEILTLDSNIVNETNLIKTEHETEQQLQLQTTVSSTSSTSTVSVSPTVKSVESLENTNKNLRIPKMCGRFRKQIQQQTTEIENIEHKHNSNDEFKKPYNDVLSVGTAYTKLFFELISRNVEQFKKSKIYRLLTQTTQPAHFIVICIISAVVLTIWPDLMDSNTAEIIKTGTEKLQQRKGSSNNTLAAIAYLGAFATHFGSQIWMTFISGLSLYFSLPRHTFGQCQQILFPKYFAFSSILSIILLILFVKYFMYTWSSLSIVVQFITFSINPIIELIIYLYLAPPMLRLMHEKYKIEDAIGSGQEVGNIVQGDLTECPHYQRIHKAFRRLHMTVAIGNMLVLGSTCLQLYFLASKIQIEIS